METFAVLWNLKFPILLVIAIGAVWAWIESRKRCKAAEAEVRALMVREDLRNVEQARVQRSLDDARKIGDVLNARLQTADMEAATRQQAVDAAVREQMAAHPENTLDAIQAILKPLLLLFMIVAVGCCKPAAFPAIPSPVPQVLVPAIPKPDAPIKHMTGNEPAVELAKAWKASALLYEAALDRALTALEVIRGSPAPKPKP